MKTSIVLLLVISCIILVHTKHHQRNSRRLIKTRSDYENSQTTFDAQGDEDQKPAFEELGEMGIWLPDNGPKPSATINRAETGDKDVEGPLKQLEHEEIFVSKMHGHNIRSARKAMQNK